MTDAKELLSILRGTTAPSSSSTAPLAIPIPAPPSNDLDRLFNRAFSNSHPSNHGISQSPEGSGAMKARMEMSGYQGAPTEVVPPQQTQNLLNLLQTISSPAPVPATLSPAPVAAKPKTADASSLLAQLMGNSFAAPTPTPSTSSAPQSVPEKRRTTPKPPAQQPQQREVENSPKAKASNSNGNGKKAVSVEVKKNVVTGGQSESSPQPLSTASVPLPKAPSFNFQSPFDFFSAIKEPPAAKAAVPVPFESSTNEKPQTTPSSTALVESAGSSDTDNKPISTSIPLMKTATAGDTFLCQKYLEEQQAKDSLSTKQGVRFPLAGSEDGQTLRFDIREKGLERLSSQDVTIQPVTLFAAESKWEKGTRVADWNGGMAYATKGGKIRVIDAVTGQRLLLKGHSIGVLDMAVSPSTEVVEGNEMRLVASVGADGKFIMWRVTDQVVGEAAPVFKKLVEIEGTNFTSVEFHPAFPSVPMLAFVTDDGRIVTWNYTCVHEAKDIVTSLATGGTMIKNRGAPILDIAFSPDGRTLVALDNKRNVTVRSTNALSAVIDEFKLDDPSEGVEEELCGVSYLPGPSHVHDSILVSSQSGTRLSIVGLSSPHLCTIEFVLPSVSDLDLEQQHFGKSYYHQPSSTLFVANSLRGSFFAFHLSASETGPLRVDHVLEVATPAPIIDFCIKDVIAGATVTAMCVHPGGIHLIGMSHSAHQEGTPSVVKGGESSQSLEKSTPEIKVDTLGKAEVEAPLTIKKELSPTPTPARIPSPVVKVPVVEPSIPLTDALLPPTVAEPLPSVASAPIKLAGAVTTAAIKSMKDKKGKQISRAQSPLIDERSIKEETPTPSTAEAVANMWASGGAANVKKGGKAVDSSLEVLKEIKRIEDSIPSRVAKLVAKELEKLGIASDEEKLAAKASKEEEISRQSEILKSLSHDLANHTSQQFETIVKDQIKAQVVPTIGKFVSGAVSEQIAKGVADAIKNSLPNELEKLLYRPDLTAHLARNFSSAIGPSFEKNLTAGVVTTVIPSITKSVNVAFEGLVKSMRAEITGVRKEIVKEQSKALEATEQEVRMLKTDLKDVKAALERMENLVLSLRAPAARPVALQSSPPPPQPYRIPTAPQPQHLNQQAYPAHHTQQQQNYSLPPIPRSETPAAKYEELFTNALQPQNESEFTSLLYLIKSSPVTRLEGVFPHPPSKPNISPPVVLSLAYRMSQVVGTKSGSLDDEGKKQLQWIRKCITAMDGKDAETEAYTPRILESVISSLALRGGNLAAQGDRRGVEEVRIIEAYARSRLHLLVERNRR